MMAHDAEAADQVRTYSQALAEVPSDENHGAQLGMIEGEGLPLA